MFDSFLLNWRNSSSGRYKEFDLSSVSALNQLGVCFDVVGLSSLMRISSRLNRCSTQVQSRETTVSLKLMFAD